MNRFPNILKIRLTDKQNEQTNAIAKSQGVSQAQVIRQAVDMYCKNEEGMQSIERYMKNNPDTELTQALEAFMELKFSLETIANKE